MEFISTGCTKECFNLPGECEELCHLEWKTDDEKEKIGSGKGGEKYTCRVLTHLETGWKQHGNMRYKAY